MDIADKNEDRLDELLAAWEAAKSVGQEPRLEDLCPDDEGLRKMLASRIASLQRLREFLILDEELSAPYALPRFIGKYEVQDVVASSGVGIVCRCIQPAPYRDVAVKLLQPLQAAGIASDRFRLEAQILGLMKHSGIAQIFEAGIASVLDNPMPFIAMEYIDGCPLDVYASERQLGTRQRIELVLALCEAMGHAHRQGIVHRDLKPANVLVTVEGHVKVVDFGIARITDTALRQSLVKHDTVGIVGSLAYTSPEQLTGEADGLDERADVYAIGVILYELLTGRLPFSPNSHNYLQLIRQISLNRPVSIGTLDRRLKGDLEAIVNKAMEKAPKDRYLTCDQLAAELRRYLRGAPVQARRVNPLIKTWRWVKRNPEVAALVFAIPAILTASLWIVTYLAVETSRALAKEEAATNTALRLREEAREREQLATELAEVAREQAEEMRRRAYNATLTEVQRLKRSATSIARSVLSDPRACPPEYQSLAWNILVERHRFEPLQWQTDAEAFDVAFSPTGDQLVTTGAHGQVRFWDALTGQLLTARRGILHRERVLTFDPAGVQVVTATDQRAIRIWNSADQSHVVEFTGHVAPITTTAIADDRRLVASADSSGAILLWKSPTGELVHALQSLGPKLVSLRFTAEDHLLGMDLAGNLMCWNVSTGAREWLHSLSPEWTHGLISPRGGFAIGSIGREPRIEVFRTSDGEHLKTIPLAGRNHGVYSVAADDSLIAAQGGGRIDIWSTDTWEQVNRLSGHATRLAAISFGPQASRLASVDVEGEIKIQDTLSAADRWEFMSIAGAVHGIRSIPGTNWHVAAVPGGALLLDLHAREILQTFHCQPTIVTNLSVAPQGDLIAVQHGDRRIQVFRMGQLEPHLESPPFRSKIREIMIAGDGGGVYVTTRDGPLEYWDLTEKSPVAIWPDLTTQSYALAQHPLADWLYVGMQNGSILFGSGDANSVQELAGASTARLSDLAVSPDGQRLAASYRDGSIALWDLVENRQIASVKRHAGAVLALDFSPDSRTLLSAGRDGFVIFWDAINGDYQLGLDCPAQSVSSVCVSKDGKWISLGTSERRVWTLTTAGAAGEVAAGS